MINDICLRRGFEQLHTSQRPGGEGYEILSTLDNTESNLDSFRPDQLSINSEVARVTSPQDGLQSEGLDREDLHSLGVEVAPVNHLFTWQFALI